MASGERNLNVEVDVENRVTTTLLETTDRSLHSFMMLSPLLRRALLRPAMLSTTQILSTRPILSNRFLALSVRRNLATTSIARDAKSTISSEPKPAPKSKPKTTRKKSASTRKASGKDKRKKVIKKKPAKRRAKKVETKKSMPLSIPFSSPTSIYCLRPLFTVTIGPQDKPPKGPGNAFILWYTEWLREQQPKIANLDDAQSFAKKGSQTWSTVSDHEKQVCVLIHFGLRVF